MGVYLIPFYLLLPSTEGHTPVHIRVSTSIVKSHSIQYICDLGYLAEQEEMYLSYNSSSSVSQSVFFRNISSARCILVFYGQICEILS